MKNSIAVAVSTALLLATGAPLAQDTKAPAPPTTLQTGSPTSMSGHMGDTDAHMKQMQGLHEKMMNAKTPAERQTVMEEQRKSMQAGMGMMHQMPGGDMMGGMGGSMMAQKGKPADMTTQMQMMQKRMDMMQMMMQSMIDQQGMMGAPNAGK